jgi:AcrR family transcriptional regulator
MPRLKQRTPQMREQLLSAALDLLAEEGPAGLTMRSLAARADTSPPAVYELFGDKSGVIREVYLEGFRKLSGELTAVPETADPLSDLWNLTAAYRRFVRNNRTLADVMYTQPFADFQAGRDEHASAGSVGLVVAVRVRRCIEQGRLRGDETDVALVLVALVQGMAHAEAAGRLGSSTESVERRWRLAIGTALNGFGARPASESAPERAGTPRQQ